MAYSIVGINKEESEFLGICLRCKAVSEFVYDDYVDKPMVWCWTCDSRCVLDITNTDIRNEEFGKLIGGEAELSKLYPGISYVNDDDKNVKDYLFYVVENLFITKVLNNDMADYKATRDITQAEIRNFVESDYNETIGKQYGIIKRICENDEINFNRELRKDGIGKKDMRLALDCLSYDAEYPINPYPEEYTLDHGGIFVYLEIQDKNNRTMVVRYWGD
jgi:hypothetical protein